MNQLAKAVDNQMGKVPVVQGKGPADRSVTGETMKAITWHGKEDVRVSIVPKPVLTDPKDVILKVTATTVCSGSDGHVYAGEIPDMDKGFTIGHECMGVVDQIGDQVTKFSVGQRVVVAFDVACGECSFCKREEFSACLRTNDDKLARDFYGGHPSALFGYGRLMGSVDGSQAQYVRVPIADVNCFALPDDVPDEKALYMSDVLCTSLHANRLGEVKENSTVAIWGAGPIGLCSARWAQILGARRIVVIDMVPERLAVAEKLGVITVDRTDMTSEELVAKVRSHFPEDGGADVVIEAVGFRFAMGKGHKIQRAVGLETDTPEILHECMDVCRPYGNVSIIGDYAGLCNGFKIGQVMFKHLTIRSGQCPCQKYFPYVLEKLRDGTFDPSFMISHRLTLDEVPDAYSKLHLKEDGFIKIFVSPNGSLESSERVQRL